MTSLAPPYGALHMKGSKQYFSAKQERLLVLPAKFLHPVISRSTKYKYPMTITQAKTRNRNNQGRVSTIDEIYN